MGIQGLLPLLKSIHKHCTLKKFAGQTIGIDGYGWLHRGSVACAIELALDKPTTKYVDFAMSRVRMLLDFGVTPYVVFDGDSLPSKAGTNDERRKRRHEAKELGLQLYKAGKMSQAYQELQKAAGVTPQMARQLIDELKKLDVQYIVAPYEADAQLAYLEQKGIINGILSEDSDLLVFGARRLITKLNQYGECVEIERADFPLCKEINLTGWSDKMFRHMAILSGCDYLPSIDKMGLKTAYRFMRKYKDVEKAIRMIAFEGKFCVPADYVDKFRNADLTFTHHRVFCPLEQKMVFLTDLDRGVKEESMPYLGAFVEPEIAVGVACGDLNPRNKQPLQSRASLQARPTLMDNRRQTLSTPSDLKPKKSIESFFKSNRTPLAELDPNSLTPSPSQQRLLERHQNASWEPRPVSSAPQLRHTSSLFSAAPTTGGSDRRAFLARASTISGYQSPKRQRLCSAPEDAGLPQAVEKSPFFISTTPAMSPLGQKKSRNRRAKREFDVWSDDSVDEILLGLVDVHEVASPDSKKPDPDQDASKNIHYLPTEDDAVPQSSPVRYPDLSQAFTTTDDSTQTQQTATGNDSISQETAATSVTTEDDADAFEDLLEYHVRKQNETLAKTFSSQPPACQSSALQSLQSYAPKDVESNLDCIRAKQSVSFTDDVHEPAAAVVPSVINTFVYQSPERQANAMKSLMAPQTEARKVELARAALARQRRDQTFGQSSNASVARQTSRTKFVPAPASITPASHIRGSEDLLAPNSEDEKSEGEEAVTRPVVDFKAFAFYG